MVTLPVLPGKPTTHVATPSEVVVRHVDFESNGEITEPLASKRQPSAAFAPSTPTMVTVTKVASAVCSTPVTETVISASVCLVPKEKTTASTSSVAI